jgi:hypothetical protein
MPSSAWRRRWSVPKTLAQVLEAIAQADGEVVLEGTKAFLLLPPGMEGLVEEAREHGRALALLALEAPRHRLTPLALMALAQALEEGDLEGGLHALRRAAQA